jgi:hypothetical protein
MTRASTGKNLPVEVDDIVTIEVYEMLLDH